uniref:Polyprenal reductase n=1 Tax=Schistosoma japonicum TaxID=6182 RepID=Q5DI64_SCHJA|nr:SJCHGC01345 protein [Schistosoma japonicum]
MDTTFISIFSPLPRIFSGFGIFCILLGILHHFYGAYSPLFVQHFLFFGKLKPQYCQSLECLRVPKRWFKYFYMIGILSTSCSLVTELFVLSFNKTIVWILFLYLIHVSRRLYECEYVSIFSNSQMSFMHFLMGVGFYIVTPISILFSRDNAVERSYLGIILFGLHFLILQYLQDLVFQQLAALRSGKNENTDKPVDKQYYPPEGSMFHWISCPHYVLEISIYISMQLFITPKWISFSHILFFTMCNQLCCIWLHHNWYKKNFPTWASKRAMLIPYVW